VLLAVALARAFGLHDTWWAAFSGFAVIRSDYDESLRRGAYRILGTIIGALISVALAGVVLKSAFLFLPYVFFCGALTLTLTLLSRHSYAWLFMGLTNIMVLAFAILRPAQLHEIARVRVAEVAIGTIASLVVATSLDFIKAPASLSLLGAVRGLSGGPAPAFATNLTIPARWRLLRHVSEAALGVTLVTALGYWFRLPNFTQAAITVLVVMIVPYADFETNRFGAVGRRLVLRGLGCLAGGAFGIVLLLLTSHFQPLWWAALPVGIWIGEHFQTGDKRVAYFGTQFGFAFIVGFVQDVDGTVGSYPAFQRLAGVMIGVAILTAIFAASHMVSAWVARRVRS